ncbi:LysR substrate-binding domain-containing protein [Pseudomonas typographi]|uniref:LysR family transcriptional regulator n=1 Tax=Pseudomonas typographi TaxID=2715964 RepID=A0ABR7Z770_9PSED|nr:LysR substrate-binding domain-containing protein [Pseudomonas typographi]MBD1554636.1 LysR family transcriptional regulator [Pseudomonas typographi]MBD1587159.1 LysR family transcriptional regulator [Pseudomonas typographi]MBD1601391.1 LysR family transcriptional regulator [Pseudomonas typographi]
MNFKQVEAFRAVMLSGSMTAAAEALHTSQPNISRLIAQLERASGFKLFERSGGRLQATDEGAALFADVERAFIGLQSIEDAALNIRRGGTGRLRIAAVPSLSLTVLPHVIQRFRQEHPGVAISIHTHDSPAVARWAASRFCDVGLASYVGEQTPGVIAKVLCDVPGVCVFPRGHRLQTLASVTPNDLEGEEFISLLHNDGSRARIDRLFPETKGFRRMNLETPYAATICSLVGLGLGVGIVSPLVAQECRHLSIDTRPFLPDIRFTTYLLLPSDRPHSVLAQRFARLIGQMLSDATQAWR